MGLGFRIQALGLGLYNVGVPLGLQRIVAYDHGCPPLEL